MKRYAFELFDDKDECALRGTAVPVILHSDHEQSLAELKRDNSILQQYFAGAAIEAKERIDKIAALQAKLDVAAVELHALAHDLSDVGGTNYSPALADRAIKALAQIKGDERSA